MTANPFAALLAKIGRYSHDCDEPHLVPEPDGKWLDRDEVLAALAAAVPADLAEAGKVVERLEQRDTSRHGYTGHPLYNRDGRQAADTIRSLIALATAQEARIEGLRVERDRRTEMHECAMSERDDATLYADEQKARTEAAETALTAMTKERDGLLTTWAESRERHLTAETAFAAERAKTAKLVEALNQYQLAAAGYVSVQSAKDKADSVLAAITEAGQ